MGDLKGIYAEIGYRKGQVKGKGWRGGMKKNPSFSVQKKNPVNSGCLLKPTVAEWF